MRHKMPKIHYPDYRSGPVPHTGIGGWRYSTVRKPSYIGKMRSIFLSQEDKMELREYGFHLRQDKEWIEAIEYMEHCDPASFKDRSWKNYRMTRYKNIVSMEG